MEASKRVKEEGKNNDLLERISSDEKFSSVKNEIADLVDPKKFIGRAPGQVEDFIKTEVTPLLNANTDILNLNVDINV